MKSDIKAIKELFIRNRVYVSYIFAGASERGESAGRQATLRDNTVIYIFCSAPATCGGSR